MLASASLVPDSVSSKECLPGQGSVSLPVHTCVKGIQSIMAAFDMRHGLIQCGDISLVTCMRSYKNTNQHLYDSPEMRDGVVVSVHLLNIVPVLPTRAVSVLAHVPVAEMLLVPIAVISLPMSSSCPNLPVLASFPGLE